jgi:hypothetical protein
MECNDIMITQKKFDAKPEIKALPKAIRQKLDNFIFKEIPQIKFFKPDGKPEKEWKVFYGSTWDAAWNAALDAVRDAARDAALFAKYIILDDVEFDEKEKYLAYVKARWEVWQKGYGLLCDVDGVLYVYAKEE